MLNPFFQQGSKTEQNLIQDLINEQLRMYGIEIHYLPRSFIHKNSVIEEVIQSAFNDAYPIEAYIQNYDGYSDNPVLLSKFGIQQTQEINLVISKERWENYIQPLIEPKPNMELTSRPKEGDLIYLPLGDRLYEIKYVEHEKPFYQLQKNYVYELRCELFRYENESINSGISEIDDELLAGASSSSGLSIDESLLGSTQTLTLSGVGVTATAYTSLVNSGISSILIKNRGGGYNSIPEVGISSSPAGGITATGIAHMISGIVVCNSNVNPGNSSVQGVYITNPGMGYTSSPNIKFIGGGGNGADASTIIADGIVGVITITSGGSGYALPPQVTISGISSVSAAATSVLDSSGSVVAVNIINAGIGYTEVPTISISDPPLVSSGDFILNEIITGSISSTKARIRNWNIVTKVLDIYNIAGEFVVGETIVGEDSGATDVIRNIKFQSEINEFMDNSDIEDEADEILDFSVHNPFGNA